MRIVTRALGVACSRPDTRVAPPTEIATGSAAGMAMKSLLASGVAMYYIAGVSAAINGAKTGTDIPKNIVTDGPVVTKDNADGMLWMEEQFLI